MLSQPQKRQIKLRIKNGLQNLPYGLGPRFFIPAARLALSLTPKRIKIRLDLKNKTRDELIEAKSILRAIASNKIQRAIIVFDNLVSPPTYGDYIYVVMLARYFIKRNIGINFVIVDGDYRYDWSSLNEKEKQFHVSYLVEIAELLLSSPITNVEVVTFQELESRLRNNPSAGSFIHFSEKVRRRVEIYGSSFNILNHLMSVAGHEFKDKFLLSFDEFVGKVKFKIPDQPYITWHCRYSEKWGEDRNTDDEKFRQIYDKLRCLYPNRAILVVSDKIGCSHFRELAHSSGLECLFSKDYSLTFMGDGALVMGSDFYYQYRAGGMNAIPFFAKLPYEIHASADKFEWQKGRVSSWATDRQIFFNIPVNESSYLPSGTIKL